MTAPQPRKLKDVVNIWGDHIFSRGIYLHGTPPPELPEDIFEIRAIYYLDNMCKFAYRNNDRSSFRHALVVSLRHGFDNGQFKSYKEIAEIMGIKHWGQVRVLYVQALQKLRSKAAIRFITKGANAIYENT